MWDERYSTEEYAYGTEPNEFLKDNFTNLPKGKILSLAEGEGRNAVFLAKNGYSVTAVDASPVGLDKAKKLAEDNGISLECVCADLAEFEIGREQWDGIISIFCPLPSQLREQLHRNVESGLKPNGVFLLEAYTPEQVAYNTGGGKSVETMQSKTSLRRELSGLSFQHLVERERNIIEGIYHTGLSSVVQAIARKEI